MEDSVGPLLFQCVQVPAGQVPVRGEGEGAPEVCSGGLDVAPFAGDKPHVGVETGVVRGVRQDGLEHGFGARPGVLVDEGGAFADGDVGGRGAEGVGAVEGVQGVFGVVPAQEEVAQAQPAGGFLRLGEEGAGLCGLAGRGEAEGGPEVLGGQVGAVEPEVDGAQVEVGQGVVGVAGEGFLLQNAFGLLRVVLLQVDGGQVVPEEGVLGLETGGLFEGGPGLVVAFQAEEGQAGVVPGHALEGFRRCAFWAAARPAPWLPPSL